METVLKEAHMETTLSVESIQTSQNIMLHRLMGPVLFIFCLLLPFFGPIQARIGFGILFWMLYWWVTVAVDINVTCLVPLFVVAFYQYIPIEKVMQNYVHRDFFLIVGATAVTAAWAKWGFAQRIALHFLLLCGNNCRVQTVGWFLLTGAISFIMGNTPVAAVFAPIAVASLLYAGYTDFNHRWNSKAASNILIAVAWGASVGGMTTPLGGGQALVTIGMMEKYLGREVYYIDWTLRMLPVSVCVMLAMAAFMYFVMRPEVETFKGTREFFRKELQKMGPMGYEEKFVAYGFFLIVLLALTRPLYVNLIKGPYFAWLHPSPLFLIFALSIFFIPSRTNQKETILSVPTLVKHFPVAVLFIWPGSVALGRILSQTGAASIVGSWLKPFIGMGDVTAITAFSFGSNMLSQVISDTAAAGVMIPMVIEAFKNWHGLEFGAVPFIWIAGSALSWSYAVASSTGAQGIVAGFGANLKRMFLYGVLGALISIAITIVYFVITVAILKMDFYLLPPIR